ncbi:MAG: tetratricopeptide repeat protein [Flavobacteriia bacterium]|nr:tetratricopeptide repeat protein [Flavobacteriia bacterium]
MKIVIAIFSFFIISLSFAQEGGTDQQLAQYYYNNGEFDKALGYYELIFQKDQNKFNFNRYYECLIKTAHKKEAEKLIKKQISADPTNFEYPVLLAEFYEQNQEGEKAQKIYENLVDDVKSNPTYVIDVYNALKIKGKYDYAFQVLEKGRKAFKENYPLNIQFAEIYNLQGKTDKMIDEYLELLNIQSNYLESVEAVLSKQIDFSKDANPEYELLRQKLLEKIQKKPDEMVYSEMLTWLFIQKKNFKGAIIQAQALDKRIKGQGQMVYELGKICIENKEYESGRNAFKYVMEYGTDNLYYYQAEGAILNSRYLEVTSNRNYSKEEISATINEYKSALAKPNRKKFSIPLIIELSHIQAYYGNQIDSAIANLEEAMTFPTLTNMMKAEIKMKLADILVLKGEIWDASLYYMQIDKDFKFEPIGHEAKFKNARIFYYDGEFDFAQSQLSILKESTTKLIANDAMDLSLLITENYGLDSNYEAMQWFANGDLLIEQHKFDEGFALFDSITKKYAYHSLSDEILLKKAKAMQMQGKWQEATVFLEELMKYYAQDILADDALFQLGDIYENHLNDKEKAAEYYKRILFDYKGSLHVIEARKRYRLLRGDKLDADDLE